MLYFWILSSYFVNLRKSSGPKLGVLSSRENLHLFLPGDKGCSLPGTVLTLQESWFNSGVPGFLPCFGWAQGLASVHDTETGICAQSKPASPAACYSFCIRVQLSVIFTPSFSDLFYFLMSMTNMFTVIYPASSGILVREPFLSSMLPEVEVHYCSFGIFLLVKSSALIGSWLT